MAKHELGHWTVARRLGFVPGDCSIEITNLGSFSYVGGAATAVYRAVATVDDAYQYLTDRMTVLFAGSLAEWMNSNGKVDRKASIEELKERGGQSDFKEVHELLHLMRNIRYPIPTTDDEARSQLEILEGPAWDKAIELVEQDSEIIAGVGDNLAARLTQPRVPAVITRAEIETLPAVAAWILLRGA